MCQAASQKAVALKGIVASVNIYGSSDGVTFEAFVLNKLVPHCFARTESGVQILSRSEKATENPHSWIHFELIGNFGILINCDRTASLLGWNSLHQRFCVFTLIESPIWGSLFIETNII